MRSGTGLECIGRALVVALLLLPSYPANARPIGITLKASIPTSCSEGGPAVLWISLHSSLTDPVLVGTGALDSEPSSLEVNVTDTHGHPVDETSRAEQDRTAPEEGFPVVYELKPHETLYYKYDLSRLFDLSRTGNYHVQVTLRLMMGMWGLGGMGVPARPGYMVLKPLDFQMVDNPAADSGPTTELALAHTTAASWGQPSGGVRVLAFLPHRIYGGTDPITLDVVLQNVSKQGVWLGVPPGSAASIRLHLTGPQPNLGTNEGAPNPGVIRLLAADRQRRHIYGDYIAWFGLAPGSNQAYRLTLSRLADLTLSGTYSLQVAVLLPHSAAALSQTIQFQVGAPSDRPDNSGDPSSTSDTDP